MADLGAIGASGTVGAAGATAPSGYAGAFLGYYPLGLMGAHATPLVGPVEVVYYPSTLPRPTFAGYQIAPIDQTARTDMEVGAARQRRRTAARNDHVTLQWVFTDAEMAAFRSWFDGAAEAAGGAAWFNGLELATGDGDINPVEARFVGPWQASLAPGLIWTVNATVEIR